MNLEKSGAAILTSLGLVLVVIGGMSLAWGYFGLSWEHSVTADDPWHSFILVGKVLVAGGILLLVMALIEAMVRRNAPKKPQPRVPPPRKR